MVRHIILWDLRDDMTAEEKAAKALEIKQGLEGLKGVIEGLEDISVRIDLLDSSNADIMLDSTFADKAALAAYQTHPSHLAVAAVVKSAAAHRSCADFEV